MPTALTIAGSDSGGSAGIQADLAAFQSLGVFGACVVTAVTAQSPERVYAWEPVSAALVAAQLDAVAADLRPAAVKSGMLGSPAVARAVADGLARHRLPHYVLDPVMVATSGARLLEPAAEAVLVGRLVPLAECVTPNLDEAAALTREPVATPDDMERAGRALLALGARAALVTGGHLPGEELLDVLVTPAGARRWAHRRIARRTHGTGCTLSAAIAAGLALGRDLERAVDDAIALVQRAIATGPARSP